MLVRSSTLTAALAPLTKAVDRITDRIDAIELRHATIAQSAAVVKEHQDGSDEKLNNHLQECRDRWTELRRQVSKAVWMVGTLLVVIIGSLIGFLAAHYDIINVPGPHTNL